jgi:hypothetical protein
MRSGHQVVELLGRLSVEHPVRRPILDFAVHLMRLTRRPLRSLGAPAVATEDRLRLVRTRGFSIRPLHMSPGTPSG